MLPRATRPYVFVSIPRCASHTVQAVLVVQRKKDHSAVTDVGILDNHAPYAVLRARYGDEELARRFTFCFVRNPWDRCVSWFEYHRKLTPYRDLTFREWVARGLAHHWHIQNGTDYGRDRTPLEQHPFVLDETGVIAVDFVGRIEHFDDDLRDVLRHLGVPVRRGRGPRRARCSARQKGYRQYYDDDTAAAVGAALAADVRLFDYRFG